MIGVSNLKEFQTYRRANPPPRSSPYTQSRPTPDTRPSSTTSSSTTSNRLGDLNYDTDKYADWNQYSLPTVNDPEQTFANIMLGEQRDYMKDFAAFEESLVAARDDTSLIDAVPEDVAMQTKKAREIAERNKRRFGVTSTAVEEREAERSLQRGEMLGLAGGLTNARVAQKEQNYKTMAGLMNVAANAYSSNINALSGASAGQVARKNAYDQAQAAYKSNVYGTIGSLGSVAILAAFGI